LLAERISALGRCVYVPHAVVYHRPRGRLGAILRWFIRRGQSERVLWRATTERGGYACFWLRSSWTLRGLALLVLLLFWPRLLLLLPPALIAYYGAMLWRFRFALTFPSHRRGWLLVPVVKLTMDLGTEIGRWRAILGRAD